MSNKPVHKVLVVDDEESILELLKYNLEKQGFDVRTATDGQGAVDVAKKFHPDLVLLDIMMPKVDGVEACRQLRAMPELVNTYIVFLTARAEEYSEVAAFDVGADDYILKPIKPRALMSRISALFRRDNAKKNTSSQIKAGNLIIDRTSYTVRLNGKEINLPKKEFELLFFLAQNPNKVFTRDD
ncbi:MAG: response regulator transcription factor, partial [Bacteroidetes bacterium]|nr:response regulator transcription factor [Bacteroidota bacterium]